MKEHELRIIRHLISKNYDIDKNEFYCSFFYCSFDWPNPYTKMYIRLFNMNVAQEIAKTYGGSIVRELDHMNREYFIVSWK